MCAMKTPYYFIPSAVRFAMDLPTVTRSSRPQRENVGLPEVLGPFPSANPRHATDHLCGERGGG